MGLTYPDGETITYTRDSRGQVARLASNQPGPGGEPPSTVDYAYNPDGSLVSMDYGFGMHVERLYDRAGRLVDLRYTKPDGTVISDFAYTHDAAGNILSKTTDFGLVQYGYDALDRLVLADYDWKADEIFAYDAVGNRTADAGHPVWHYDAANQLLAYGDGAHDPAGQTPPTVPAFTFAYDANGSTVSKTDPAAGTTDQYGYSFDNRMSEVRRDGELVARYFYDHSSQRIRKDLFTGGSPTGSTWFVFGHEGLLAEYDTAGALVRKHTWQPDRPWGVDPVCLCALGDDRYYFITDHLFTPQQMLDETFNSVWQAQRLSFGDTLTSLDLVENALGFPGQYFDTESDFYYNWNRFYAAGLGRYLQQDLITSDNLYDYSESNPILNTDPNGMLVLLCMRPLDLPISIPAKGRLMHLYIILNKDDYGFHCKDCLLSGMGEVRINYEDRRRRRQSTCWKVPCIDENKLKANMESSAQNPPPYDWNGYPDNPELKMNCWRWAFNQLKKAAKRPCCDPKLEPYPPPGSE